MILKEKDVYILNTEGDLIRNEDIVSLDNAIDSVSAKGANKVVIDLAATKYITSKFIDSCFFRLKEFRQKSGDIKLVHVSKEVKAVLKAAKVFEYVDFFESVTDAVNSFSDNVSGAEKNMLWQ